MCVYVCSFGEKKKKKREKKNEDKCFVRTCAQMIYVFRLE